VTVERTADIGEAVDAAAEGAGAAGMLTLEQVRGLFQEMTGLPDGDGDAAFDQVEEALLAGMGEPGLQVRPGGWVIDLRASAVRTALAAALVGGVMWQAGLDQLPGYVLPAVLPLLVDVRHARLTHGDRKLLLELRLAQTSAQAPLPWSADALYGRLPAAVQQQVSPVDFADFVERLVQAGEANRAQSEEVVVRQAGDPAWIRITVE
jgi:hypothetical protein